MQKGYRAVADVAKRMRWSAERPRHALAEQDPPGLFEALHVTQSDWTERSEESHDGNPRALLQAF